MHRKIIDANAYPSPLRYGAFPKSICTSVNNVTCHGIPDDRPLMDGDIVNVDITVNGMRPLTTASMNRLFLLGILQGIPWRLLNNFSGRWCRWTRSISRCNDKGLFGWGEYTGFVNEDVWNGWSVVHSTGNTKLRSECTVQPDRNGNWTNGQKESIECCACLYWTWNWQIFSWTSRNFPSRLVHFMTHAYLLRYIKWELLFSRK